MKQEKEKSEPYNDYVMDNFYRMTTLEKISTMMFDCLLEHNFSRKPVENDKEGVARAEYIAKSFNSFLNHHGIKLTELPFQKLKDIEQLKNELEEQKEMNCRILDAWEAGQSYEDFMAEELEKDDCETVPF